MRFQLQFIDALSVVFRKGYERFSEQISKAIMLLKPLYTLLNTEGRMFKSQPKF